MPGTNRPHLHGGIAANDNLLPAIQAALEDAGGTWASDHGKEHQVLVKPQTKVDG